MRKAIDKVALLCGELSHLLDQRTRLTQKRDFTQDAEEDRILSDRIAEINSKQIPDLQKRVHDAFNAAKRHSERKAFKALGGRLRGVLSGIEIVRESDVAPEHESKLLEALYRAKTNSERRRLDRELRQLRRDRSQSSRVRSNLSPGQQ